MYNQKNSASAFDEIANQLLELMQQTNLPIWKPGYYNLSQRNGKTLQSYQGINMVLLSLISKVKNFKSSYWLTFSQVKELGGSIIKEAKSSPIVYYFQTNKLEVDARENERLSNPNLVQIQPKFMPKFFKVFNLNQVQGIEIDEFVSDSISTFDEINYTVFNHPNLPKINISVNANPSYSPATDTVHMPIIEQYYSKENYYTDLFHELGHSTGHETRLAREIMVNREFGQEEYSFEELVAEFTACFCCNHFNIKPNLEMNAAYLRGWFSYLEQDPTLLTKAIKQATKATEFIIN